jgi:DNA-binding transcriptional regulator YhcF (GntR family)
MNGPVPGVDEVYAALLERIGAGVIEVGSKLPSCRVLAEELGSNPSTVNRAIRRLARHGLVRTEPRVGTFLVDAGVAPELSKDEVDRTIRDAVMVARSSGLGSVRIRELFESALAIGSGDAGVVAFVECNRADLERMASLVENTTGVGLKPKMIDELQPGWESEIDVVATPMFHLADLVELSEDLDRVVEINFIPSASVLRELSTLGSSAVVAVAAPTPRGVERMRALVSQYYAGTILTPDLDEDRPFTGVDVVVHPRAIELDADLLEEVKEVVIDWELDQASATTFVARVAAASARGLANSSGER